MIKVMGGRGEGQGRDQGTGQRDRAILEGREMDTAWSGGRGWGRQNRMGRAEALAMMGW